MLRGLCLFAWPLARVYCATVLGFLAALLWLLCNPILGDGLGGASMGEPDWDFFLEGGVLIPVALGGGVTKTERKHCGRVH